MKNQNEETLYQNITTEDKGNSELEIRGEIPERVFTTYRSRALNKLGKDMSIPGFRKGRVPENVLVERVGEQTVLQEIAEMALAEAYPKIMAEQERPVIGRPHVTITKIAPKNPIEFKIETAVIPAVELPDYKAIAAETMKKIENSDVTEAEVADVIRELRRNKWRIDNKERAEKGDEPKEEELPKLTDELVKGLGDFKDVADFNIKLTENLKREKERKHKEKKRIETADKIIEQSSIPLPSILIDSELSGMMRQFKADVARMGLDFDEYVKKIQKSEADLKKEWRPDAEKRAKLQLVLNTIAEKERIKPERGQIEKEIEHLKAHVADADPERLNVYVRSMLANEAVFQFLERQA